MEQNVIEITLNKAGFEYDIHSLVKAFYPECEVRVHAEGEGEPGSSSDGYPDISLQIGEEEIVLVLIQAGGGSSSFHAKKVVISDTPDRTEVKNRLKKLIYVALSEYTGKQLPWGTLTGIRPTKIPMTMLLEGRNEEEILSYMKRKRQGFPWRLQRGKRSFFPRSTIRTATACISGSPSARLHACIVLLRPSRSYPGKRESVNIWKQWKRKLPLRQRSIRTRYWTQFILAAEHQLHCQQRN